MRRSTGPDCESLRCSFCHKSQKQVGKLISSPSDYPRAYICDECIETCKFILDDDRPESGPAPEPTSSDTPHPLLSHPLASELMDSVIRWVTQESVGQPAPAELARLRDIVSRMLQDGH